VGTLPQKLSSLELTGEPVMVQRKKKPSDAQIKRLRKQQEAPYKFLTSSRPGSTKDNFAPTKTGTGMTFICKKNLFLQRFIVTQAR